MGEVVQDHAVDKTDDLYVLGHAVAGLSRACLFLFCNYRICCVDETLIQQRYVRTNVCLPIDASHPI